MRSCLQMYSYVPDTLNVTSVQAKSLHQNYQTLTEDTNVFKPILYNMSEIHM